MVKVTEVGTRGDPKELAERALWGTSAQDETVSGPEA